MLRWDHRHSNSRWNMLNVNAVNAVSVHDACTHDAIICPECRIEDQPGQALEMCRICTLAIWVTETFRPHLAGFVLCDLQVLALRQSSCVQHLWIATDCYHVFWWLRIQTIQTIQTMNHHWNLQDLQLQPSKNPISPQWTNTCQPLNQFNKQAPAPAPAVRTFRCHSHRRFERPSHFAKFGGARGCHCPHLHAMTLENAEKPLGKMVCLFAAKKRIWYAMYGVN